MFVSQKFLFILGDPRMYMNYCRKEQPFPMLELCWEDTFPSFAHRWGHLTKVCPIVIEKKIHAHDHLQSWAPISQTTFCCLSSNTSLSLSKLFSSQACCHLHALSLHSQYILVQSSHYNMMRGLLSSFNLLRSYSVLLGDQHKTKGIKTISSFCDKKYMLRTKSLFSILI